MNPVARHILAHIATVATLGEARRTENAAMRLVWRVGHCGEAAAALWCARRTRDAVVARLDGRVAHASDLEDDVGRTLTMYGL